MLLRHLVLTIAVAACAFPARTEMIPRGAPARAAMPATPRAEPPGHGWLRVFEERLTDQPVVVVQTSGGQGPDIRPFRDGESLLSKLQTIGDAVGDPVNPLIPYAVRAAWVLAPRQRDEIVTDVSALSVEDAMGRAGLWQEALALLTPSQVSEMGLPNGLALTSFSGAGQDRLRRALRPPVTIRQTKPDNTESTVATLTEPMDWRGVRIRAELRLSNPEARGNADGSGGVTVGSLQSDRRPPGLMLGEGADNSGFNDFVHLSGARRVPNTFKPSDLDGKKYRDPIGIQGVFPLSEVLTHAGEVTGLQLAASTQYTDLPVFVGSRSLPAGDVLDGLRLALTASWRRLGGLYFLTWDRIGLGAMQELARERRRALVIRASAAADAMSLDPIWADFVDRLPFAADDSFGLTEKQRAALFGTPPTDTNRPEDRTAVAFPAMTPAQQNAVREAVAGQMVRIAPSEEGGEWGSRPVTEDDVRRVVLPARVEVEFSIQVPGTGWVNAPEQWGRSLDGGTVDEMRSRARRPSRSPATATAPPPPRPRQAAQRTLQPARARAVIAPVLSAAQVAPLATLMEARGFTTLFYPLLTDGKATIVSKAFPPHPALAAGGGFAAVARVMRAHGISTVACIETLAWRAPGEAGHWLAKYPGWLDADILGRSLSDDLAAQAEGTDTDALRARGDLVRPREPAVVTRLETLARECAAMPNASGLLFDAWNPQTTVMPPASGGRGAGAIWEIASGYAAPDRLAAVRRDGVDPVDVPARYGGALGVADAFYYPTGPSATGRTSTPARIIDGRLLPPAAPPPSPEDHLLARLAAVRPPTARAWATYAIAAADPALSFNGGTLSPALPVSTTIIEASTRQGGADIPNVAFHVPPRGQGRLAPMTDDSTPAIIQSEGTMGVFAVDSPLDLAVYDFRDAPRELMDSLQRVGLPPDPPKAPTPPVARGGSR
jgi:hypothetical protein